MKRKIKLQVTALLGCLYEVYMVSFSEGKQLFIIPSSLIEPQKILQEYIKQINCTLFFLPFCVCNWPSLRRWMEQVDFLFLSCYVQTDGTGEWIILGSCMNQEAKQSQIHVSTLCKKCFTFESIQASVSNIKSRDSCLN